MRIFVLVILLLGGCSWGKPSAYSAPGLPPLQSVACPDKPTGLLKPSKVKAIALTTQNQSESGVLKAGDFVGFSFESQGNEKFNYVTSNNLCIWIFSPDNQILQGTQLTKKGHYTVQVALPTGSASFELTMRLEPLKSTFSSPSASPPAASTSMSSDDMYLSNLPKDLAVIQERTERISFATGTTDTTIQDTVRDSQLIHYLLGCSAGQTMTIRSQSGGVNIQIIDPNGRTIGRLSSNDSNWRGTLPSNGDYSLDVSSSTSSNFSIQVEVL